MNVKIEESWKQALQAEFEKPYFAKLVSYLYSEKAKGRVIYPPGPNIFRAFELTPLQNVKVVILGQDPYHNPEQAMGLSFSVPDGIPVPPSLLNIFKEIHDDTGVEMSGSPNLEPWALQGVLLLNAILTVRAGQAASHQKIGWEEFTDAVISHISNNCNGIVFMLWGNFARSKAALINPNRHLILEAPHPSPLARGAFFGCKHFSKANNFLTFMGKKPIDWRL